MNVLDQRDGKNWTIYNADVCDAIAGIPDESIDVSVFSPPFASLYTYSASDRDMGNCSNGAEFSEHLRFLMPHMARVMRPGRNICVHCMDLPTLKYRDGQIGLIDFPGDIIRAATETGLIWHSRVIIWKDPVTAMQRTKALGLLHKQVRKDSCMSRQGIPDYVLVFRKPGTNPSPVAHSMTEFPISLWQQWASPVWQDVEWSTDHKIEFPPDLWAKWHALVWPDIDPSDTLQARSAREDADEKHVCPLQLDVIRRCLNLWSNKDDVVLSPFAGIGSEGYVALEEGRKFIGFELKRSYFEQAAKNLATVEPNAKGKQMSLLDMLRVKRDPNPYPVAAPSEEEAV